MKSCRYLARFIALLVVLTLVLSISSVLVAGQDTGPGSHPEAPQANTMIFMPLVQNDINAIYGRVTENGVAAPNIVVTLHLYNAGVWSQIMSTTTKANGYYAFAGANNLLPGQKYKAIYQNPNPGEENPTRLWTWETRELTSYSSDHGVNIGNFDIANLELGEPNHLFMGTLPRTFTWTPRPASPSDNYEFGMSDYNDRIPSFKVTDLGYVSSYNYASSSLPAGFLYCIPYAWGLKIHSPDGGWGYPYWFNAVTFYTVAPSGIHGCVAESGVPRSGVQVELHRLNRNVDPWIDENLGPATTNASGYFEFTGKPALGANQVYFVQYPNKESNPARLWVWYTRPIGTYAAGSPVHIGDLDIANIPLLLPPDGVTVNLPETFSWTPRPVLQADSYVFDLYEDCNGCPYSEIPPLGYVGQYTLTSMQTGFTYNKEYWWDIIIYSPYDDAYGISYDARAVTFSQTAMSAAPTGTLSEAQRQQIRYQRMLRHLQTRHQVQPGLRPDFEAQPGQP